MLCFFNSEHKLKDLFSYFKIKSLRFSLMKFIFLTGKPTTGTLLQQQSNVINKKKDKMTESMR